MEMNHYGGIPTVTGDGGITTVTGDESLRRDHSGRMNHAL